MDEMSDQIVIDSFTGFVTAAEPRLKRALCAAFGREVGLEVTSEALAYAWEHWDRIESMENSIGYLYRVGRSKARPFWRSRARVRNGLPFPPVSPDRLPWVEPSLPGAVAQLSRRQRLGVVLVHGYGWTHAEVAGLMGVSPSTVQNHVERGMRRLRSLMGVDHV